MDIPRWSKLELDKDSKRSRAKWIKLFIIFSCALAALLLVSQLRDISTAAPPIEEEEEKPPPPSAVDREAEPIPNNVHYTMMKRTEDAELSFSFHYFLSVYAAHVNIAPDIIFIHHDFNQTMLDRARDHGNKWTRMLFTKFPEIQWNYIVPPTGANGREFSRVEHKSDMVRFTQVYERGGMYMDLDVYALRNVTALRYSGFNAIVGREIANAINNGCFMLQKRSILGYLMDREQFKVYDGGYATHSVLLLTAVAERLVFSPREVFIMDYKAFAPSGFSDEGIKRLHDTHDKAVPVGKGINQQEQLPINRWDSREQNQDWEMDFSSSYFLHAFKRHEPEKMPYFSGYNVKFVQARKSNFALALYDIVAKGIEEGVFKSGDTTP